MQLFSKLSLPAAYTKHISFLDFERFQKLSKSRDVVEDNGYGYKRPIFINMVREPINRIISWYYYVRAPWYIVNLGFNGTLRKFIMSKLFKCYISHGRGDVLDNDH